MLAVVLPFLYMLFYNALVVPLLITFLAIGLLWRNAQARTAADTAASAPRFPVLPAFPAPADGALR